MRDGPAVPTVGPVPPWATAFLELAPTWMRAPSAHNTQPWTITIAPGGVVVGWDSDRTLPAGDPTDRDLWLTLGGFSEVAAACLASLGVEPTITIAVDRGACRFGVIEVDAGATTQDTRPADTSSPGATSRTPVTGRIAVDPALVGIRRTHRGPMTDEVSAKRLDDLDRAAGLDPGVRVVLDPGLVLDTLPTADRWLFDEPAVTAELRSWLRLSPRHPDHDRDGLSARALALARWEAFALGMALRPPVIRALRAIGATRLLAQASSVAGMGTVVALVGPPEADPDQLGRHGRLLVRWWLAAARHGLATHPLSQLLDCPTTGYRLDRAVGRPVVAVFRIGRPAATPVVSARRPAAEVVC